MVLPADPTRVGVLNWLIAIILAVGTLHGCAGVNFAPNYDPVMDEVVTKLQVDTASFFGKISSSEADDISYAANQSFYHRALGTVEALQTRAAVLEEDLPTRQLSDNFNRLKEQYQDLRTLHQTKPPSSALKNAKKAFDQIFRAILFHIRFLKTDNGDSTAT